MIPTGARHTIRDSRRLSSRPMVLLDPIGVLGIYYFQSGVRDMTTTAIGYTLAGLIAAAIIFIGARFIIAPRAAAAAYGVQPDLSQRSAGAYLSVKGIRDIVSGLIVVILMLGG